MGDGITVWARNRASPIARFVGGVIVGVLFLVGGLYFATDPFGEYGVEVDWANAEVWLYGDEAGNWDWLRLAVPSWGIGLLLLFNSLSVDLWNNAALKKSIVPIDNSRVSTADAVRTHFSSSGRSKIYAVAMLSILSVIFVSSPFVFHFGSPFEVNTVQEGALWGISLVLPVVVVWPVYVLVKTIARWGRVAGFGLSPTGIYVYAWTATSFFPWESLYGARAIDHNGPGVRLDIREQIPRADAPKPEEDWLGKWWLFRQGMRNRQLAQLGVHPALAFYAICYYLKHPEHRQELGTERAVERIRAMDMPDVIAEVKEHGDIRPEFWTATEGSAGSG